MISGKVLPGTSQISDLISAVYEIYRRAVDGTVKPLFVDTTNQRVIIGGVATAGSNAPFQVQSGDIEITTAAKGVILKDDGGSGKTCRITATFDSASQNWNLTLTTVSALILILLSSNSYASSKTINEGVAATGNTIFIDTVNTRVDIDTRTYGGGISSVGLFVSSNAVFSNSSAANNVVIYATGSVVAKDISLTTFTARGYVDFSAAQMSGGGLWRQYVSSAVVGHYVLGANQIPNDDTIPQLSEGYKLLTATVTAKNANSNLMFDATINVAEASNLCDFGVMCVFKDITADALACNAFSLNNAETSLRTARLHYVTTITDTSSHYYTLTIGTDANLACLEINGQTKLGTSARVYGGALVSTFEIIEFEGR